MGINKCSFLFVLPTSKLGGAENIMNMLARHYDHTIYIYILKNEGLRPWEAIPGVKIDYAKTGNKLLAFLSLARYLRFHKVRIWDRIHTSHIAITAAIGLMQRIGILKKKIFIGRESTTTFSRFRGTRLIFYKILYKSGYYKLDLLICQTEKMKSELLEGAPFLNKFKVSVIKNPIDLEEVQKKANDPIDAALASQKYIVSAGRLIPEKGFDILLEAFHMLRAKGAMLKLLILGEGPMKDELEKIIVKLNLIDDVQLLGFKENIMPYLKHAEMCIVSSRVEGFPNTLLQMMACNSRIISTICADGIQLMQGITVVQPNDPIAIFNAMMRHLEAGNDVETRSLIKKELDDRSLKNFVASIDNFLCTQKS